jgi:hypothetical protein
MATSRRPERRTAPRSRARSRSIHSSNTSSSPRGGFGSGCQPKRRTALITVDGEVADLVSAMPRPSPAHVSSQRSGASASSPPGGTGTGSSGLPANRGSTGSTSARRASPRLRAHALSRSAATTTSSQLRPSSSGPAAARCRRATACWAVRQLLAPGRSLPPATASSSAAATETKAPASLAHHPPPGEPQPRPGQVRQLHPGALLRPAALPEALPAAALVGLQHRGGLGPTADRRVAGQPDQLQQPPQRSGDVQLASDPSATCAAARATGTPAARSG